VVTINQSIIIITIIIIVIVIINIVIINTIIITVIFIGQDLVPTRVIHPQTHLNDMLTSWVPSQPQHSINRIISK
jgi:hypothetical protein